MVRGQLSNALNAFVINYLPLLLIVASIIGYIFAYFYFKSIEILIYASFIFIPVIGASIYLVYNSKYKINRTYKSQNFNISIPFCRLFKIVMILLCVDFVWLMFGNRGVFHLVLLFILYVLIFLQILSIDAKKIPIIIEIFFVSLLLIMPQFFDVGFFVGDGDLVTHSIHAASVVSTGTVNSIQMIPYRTHPLYSIGIAIFSLFTFEAINSSLYIYTTIVVSFVGLFFLYLLTYRLTKSYKISLISVYLYSLSPIFIKYLLYPGPRLIVSVFFLIILVIYLKKTDSTLVSCLLSLICSLYIVFVHHAQLLILLTLVFFIIFGTRLYYKKYFVGNKIPFILFIITVIASLIYTYLSTIVAIIKVRLISSITSNTALTIDQSMTSSIGMDLTSQTMLMVVSSSVMIILILIGLWAMSKYFTRNQLFILFIPFILICLIIIIPNVLDVLPYVRQALNIYRFRLAYIPFFSIVMAIGLVFLLSKINKDKIGIVKTSMSIILIIALIVSTPIVGYSNDPDVFNDITPLKMSETYLSYSALYSVNFINKFIPENSILEKDRYSYVNIDLINDYNAKNQINYKSKSIINLFMSDNYENLEHTYIVLSAYKYNHGALITSNGFEYVEGVLTTISRTEENEHNFKRNVNDCNCVYSNDDVIIFSFNA